MNNLVSFENSFMEEHNNLSECDAFASICIDGYPADEDASGEVVARVWITKHGDIVVDWHNNGYRMNANVLSLIEESKNTLLSLFTESN